MYMKLNKHFPSMTHEQEVTDLLVKCRKHVDWLMTIQVCFHQIQDLREGFKKKIVEFSTKRGGGGQDQPIFH